MPYELRQAFLRVRYFCVFQHVRLDAQLAVAARSACRAVLAMHHRHNLLLTLVEVNLSNNTFLFFTVML